MCLRMDIPLDGCCALNEKCAMVDKAVHSGCTTPLVVHKAAEILPELPRCKFCEEKSHYINNLRNHDTSHKNHEAKIMWW